MENMKYFNFYRESNDFTDILNDITLKKKISEAISWSNYLRIGMLDDDRIASYVTLKYGDEMRSNLTEDYSPIPNIDYIPVRR
jgi:hypothetical protein